MATSQHTDEVEIAASVAHSQGQPPLEHATDNAAQQGASISFLDTSDTTIPKPERLSTGETLVNVSSPEKNEGPSESTTQYTPHQQPSKNLNTGEPHGIANILSSAVFTGTSEQSSPKCLLKDIFIEFSSPHQSNDELTLAIVQSSNSKTLRLTKISSTKWKAVENINFHHDAGDMIFKLIVHSKDGGDEVLLTLTADIIYALACHGAGEDTPAECAFASVKEDIPTSIKMSFTVASSSKFGSGDMNTAQRAIAAICDLRRAQAFERHFKETGNVDDITQIIFHYERAAPSVPPGSDVLPIISSLGHWYLHRFELIGDIRDINRAISHQQSAVKLTPSGHASLPRHCNNLGNSYARRFEHTGDLEDIDHAISYHQTALESTPSGHANVPSWFNNLGSSYACRFKRTGDLEDIDGAISHHQTAVELTPPGHANLPRHFNNLGSSYACRFKCTGDLEDIDHAISHHQTAVESSPSGHANVPSWFNNLGSSYACRFKRTGDLEDIDRAISHHQTAVELTPPGHANLPRHFNNLGSSYACRFKCTGDLEDIDHAISHHQTALESTPSGHADLPSWFDNLGSSYACRFKHTGDLQDIDHAISHHQNALKSTPAGHADLSSLFNNLGYSYLCRFEHSGNLQDIDHAISHLQTALESAPSGHAEISSWFNNLGSSYLCRFKHTSDLQDIDHAISHHQTALKSTPSGHADLLSRFNNLGSSYLCRFEHTGDLQDIDRAISHHQSAVESTPSGNANLPNLFSNLGSSYLRRFKRTGDLQDVEHSISHHQNALKSTPSGHADLPSFFSNLGSSYLCRFERTGDLQDLDHAISHHQSAIESTPSGHADLPGWFNNLGASYSHHFEHTGDVQDIDRSISHYQTAVESTPSGHADLPSQFKNLGTSYKIRFKHTHYFPDVQNSIASYRRAAEANGTPSIRLKSARQAAMLSTVHGHSQCLIDFGVAISLLSEVAGLEQTIHRRHANLHDYSDLVGFAVATALHFDKADLALEWLEQGRCLVWNQLNQLRTPIDNLRMGNPSLADRFITVASALESYGSRSVVSIPSSHATLADDIRLQDDARHHTIHATEYKQLLKEIRGLPDFDDFLQPPKAANLLSSLPSDGPVVIFNIHKTRCDALAVMSGIEEPLHIPLENFSLVQAEELQKTLRFDLLKQREVEDQDRMPQRVRPNPSSMLFVLKELWCKVVQPILEVLGYSLEFPPSPLDRGRIWWCPTGPLAFLPLHAAGIYGSVYQPGSCISDFMISSYTPTVRSLNNKFFASSTSSKCTSLILISQPNTPGLSSIPSTRKETHDLEALMKGTAIDALLLEDSEATREKVKAEMKSRSWVHFACHGVQDVHQPLESGLCLHDGRLELLEIMKQQIPNLDLAFLSACQTSKGDLKLSEEVVHLAAGMLAAGYRGVVGTMWSISDMHGPEFATEFYQYLIREKGSEGLDSTQAAYALDHATRKVRESLGEGDTAFLTWVPYVHFGY